MGTGFSVCPAGVSEEAAQVPWAFLLGQQEPEEPQRAISVLLIKHWRFQMLLAHPRRPGPTATPLL